MPRRKRPFITGEMYHVFNRSIGGLNIFDDAPSAHYFFDGVGYYIKEKPPVRFSIYRQVKFRDIYPDLGSNLVEIYGYTLMPNHFHFLIKQLQDHGVQLFIQRLCNSFSHYYNLLYERKGPLFESVFRSVRIETDEQCIHVLRYIDLNATTSNLCVDPFDYPYSSARAHIGLETTDWIDPLFIHSRFGGFDGYKKFVLDNKDYQRKLGNIKKLILE